jgi:hypothetical protein
MRGTSEDCKANVVKKMSLAVRRKATGRRAGYMNPRRHIAGSGQGKQAAHRCSSAACPWR